MQNKTLLQLQLEKVGLDNFDNWYGDPRDRLLMMLSPVLDGSNYSLRINTTDSSGKIMELVRGVDDRRIMGFALHPKNRNVGAFFNQDFYNKLGRYIVLPENQKPYRLTQPHVTLTLEEVWLVLRVATEIIG